LLFILIILLFDTANPIKNSLPTGFIDGLTVLNRELFLVRRHSPDVVVYCTNSFAELRRVTVDSMGLVGDITSCKRKNAVYIADITNTSIYQIDQSLAGHRITWSVPRSPIGLSVTASATLLVTCHGVLYEYMSNGDCVKTTHLHWSVVNPKHAVELVADQYVVCHGDPGDQAQRVCIVNSSGQVLKYVYRVKQKPCLSGPSYMAVNGFIFVADTRSRKVMMLSPALLYPRDIVVDLKGPSKICFDSDTDRLYIADNGLDSEAAPSVDGQVAIYSIITN